jgi:hypothetical protein
MPAIDGPSQRLSIATTLHPPDPGTSPASAQLKSKNVNRTGTSIEVLNRSPCVFCHVAANKPRLSVSIHLPFELGLTRIQSRLLHHGAASLKP